MSPDALLRLERTPARSSVPTAGGAPAASEATDALVRLERLRRFRGRRERDTSIAPLIGAVARELARQDRAVGGADDAWRRIVPERLSTVTRVISFARGTLHVAADSSAVAFEIDRVLRSGAEAELRAALRCGSLRVRVRVGA